MSARRERKSAYPMISVDEALLTVLKQTSPLPPKKVGAMLLVDILIFRDHKSHLLLLLLLHAG